MVGAGRARAFEVLLEDRPDIREAQELVVIGVACGEGVMVGTIKRVRMMGWRDDVV